METNSLPAQYGDHATAAVNVITKGGGNNSYEANPAVASAKGTTQAHRLLNQINATQGAYYGTIGQYDDGGVANYNGILLSLQRHSKVVDLVGNYTYAHCLSEAETTETDGTFVRHSAFVCGERTGSELLELRFRSSAGGECFDHSACTEVRESLQESDRGWMGFVDVPNEANFLAAATGGTNAQTGSRTSTTFGNFTNAADPRTTWVSRPIPEDRSPDEEIFGVAQAGAHLVALPGHRMGMCESRDLPAPLRHEYC